MRCADTVCNLNVVIRRGVRGPCKKDLECHKLFKFAVSAGSFLFH